MTIEAGTRLLHHELADKISEGGMGVVWKARDTQMNRDVAIKLLPPALTQEPAWALGLTQGAARRRGAGQSHLAHWI